MKRILMIGLLAMGLGGCNGSDNGGGAGGGNTSSVDPYTAQVLALVGTAPEDTEPTDYTGVVVTSENSEPIDR